MLVLICNTDRGALVPIKGMPWVVLIVLGVLAAWTVLLGRTRFGRYVYAIGGNAEAARRAGINLARIRTLAFALCVVHRGHRRASSTRRGCGRSPPPSTAARSCSTRSRRR